MNWNLVTINISPLSTHYYKVLSVHEIIVLNIRMQVNEMLLTGHENNTFHSSLKADSAAWL